MSLLIVLLCINRQRRSENLQKNLPKQGIKSNENFTM